MQPLICEVHRDEDCASRQFARLLRLARKKELAQRYAIKVGDVAGKHFAPTASWFPDMDRWMHPILSIVLLIIVCVMPWSYHGQFLLEAAILARLALIPILFVAIIEGICAFMDREMKTGRDKLLADALALKERFVAKYKTAEDELTAMLVCREDDAARQVLARLKTVSRIPLRPNRHHYTQFWNNHCKEGSTLIGMKNYNRLEANFMIGCLHDNAGLMYTDRCICHTFESTFSLIGKF